MPAFARTFDLGAHCFSSSVAGGSEAASAAAGPSCCRAASAAVAAAFLAPSFGLGTGPFLARGSL